MIDSSQVIYDKGNGRIGVKTVNNEPTKTQQQFKDECDINNIIARYEKTGELSHLSGRKGAFTDLSDVTDYQGMLHTVIQAEEAFMTLPAVVRTRFRNDPGQLLSFLQDPKNKDEAIKLGLIDTPVDPEPPSEPVSVAKKAKKASTEEA